MACNVYFNGKLILECSVGAFQIIYEILDEYSDVNNLYCNNDFKRFMDEMFNAVASRCSYGFDFAEHIHKKDVLDLVIIAIDATFNELKKELIERVIADIQTLRLNLLNYRSKLC